MRYYDDNADDDDNVDDDVSVGKDLKSEKPSNRPMISKITSRCHIMRMMI